jgi:hypothetical protein
MKKELDSFLQQRFPLHQVPFSSVEDCEAQKCPGNRLDSHENGKLSSSIASSVYWQKSRGIPWRSGKEGAGEVFWQLAGSRNWPGEFYLCRTK